MWPSSRRSGGPGLAARLDGPTAVDVVARVASANEATSPLSGARAAFVHIEVLERLPEGGLVSLGAVIFGDLVTLAIEDEALVVELVVRRAEMHFPSMRSDGVPLAHVPPELVPMLSHATRGGALCQREHLVCQGDRVRLRAVVEGDYRSDALERLVVRDDLGPVWLDEVLKV